ncbi:Dynamin [Penicillium samsonianum]|uniref:Dynamin n=1 Tax=Penicillium samsonianum TaxID=1882272 RepID=UPI002548FBE6|nr:Dynamin [Penicillium samsonianum]KAJ6118957.1 Dynamin [Penicillium samsonianum]
MAVLPPDKRPIPCDSSQPQKNLSLQSSKTSKRLNQIDRIRANGVGDHIALPQLVVCGDQSAGNSSVLEGISGIPFPRQDGLCTRFATEIILRHEPTDIRTTATIIPHSSRSEEDKRHLNAYRHVLHSFEELPSIIEQAAKLMGVRGVDTQAEGTAFAADVLRLELVGNTGLHLTIVDLPGLISVAECEEDVRDIIPATSDIDTQGIIQRARRFDADGLRTVGIITKPDLINAGTEARITRLANNCDRTKLTLGFFVLKNPSPTELKAGMTTEERRRMELAYFSTEPWKKQGLDPSRVGVDKLRYFLEEILDRHIERELPKVREDIRRLLREKNEELDELGAERDSPNQIRMFLTKIGTNYYNVIQAGVDGLYGGRDASFFEIRDGQFSVRLRATIHMENEKFSDYSRHERNYRDTQSPQIYDQTRGQELPGNYNQALLAELFHVQLLRWAQIAREHIVVVAKIVSRFVNAALTYAIKDGKVARKTFVDNVCRQVIERHILAKLADAFSPMTVSFYSEEELINLAVESTQIGHLRSEARRLQAALEQSLRDLAG